MGFLVNTLGKLVLLSAGIAGASLVTMMAVTCVNVVLRKLGYSERIIDSGCVFRPSSPR